LSPSPPAKAQSYNVACSEGHRLRGERTVGYQALRCPTCGEGIFILPRSPLPEPNVPASNPRAPRPVPAVESDLEPEPIALTDPVAIQGAPDAPHNGADDWGEAVSVPVRGDPAEAGLAEIEQRAARDRKEIAPEKARRGQGDGQRERGVAGGAATRRRPDRPVAAPEADAPDRSEGRRGDLAGWVRRRRNSLLFLAVGLLIVATVGIRYWRQRRQDLPRIATLGRVEGLSALDEGKFDKAYQLLSEARHAVESLGGAVEGADQIRQGAAEAAIIIGLVPDRLEAILDQAGRYDPKEWPDHFRTLYKGRTILVDAHVVAVPDASGQGRFELDYQVFPDGEGSPLRVARLDTTGFRLFEGTRPRVGDRVQFGARLDSFARDERAEEWRIGLEPDSGVIITHTKALEALGWPGAADVPSKDGDGNAP
jgi:hypothetical protein